MNTFFRFLYEFLGQFFLGIWKIVQGFYQGIIQMFNIKGYAGVVEFYKNDFNGAEWIFVALAVLCILVFLALFIFLFYFIIRKYIRFRKTLVEQESMLEEIATLNNEVKNLMKEKQDILAMKVSQLGLSPDESAEVEEGETSENKDVGNDGVRFSKLALIDERFANYKIQNYNNTFNLPELVELFRNFAGSKLRLFYKTEIIRLFISALAYTKLVILQGISGTGKTSLAYAWGKFLKHDSCVASVQPSWRDRTELFGYIIVGNDEDAKIFNEYDNVIRV